MNILKNVVYPYLKDPLLLSKWVDEQHPVDPNRVTSWVNGGYRNRQRSNDGPELFMFNQDMTQYIMPFRSSNHSEYSAHIESPSSPNIEQIITDAISNHRERDLSTALAEFVRRATQSLFYYKRAYFELECVSDSTGNLTGLSLHDVFPLSMKTILGMHFQIIPWKAARHASVKAGIYKIPSDRIIYIPFPKKLGGIRGISKISNRLFDIGKTPYPQFNLDAMQQNKDIGFKFDVYIRDKYIEIAQLTRGFGWNQRQTSDNNILEYYQMHRYATGAISRARMRNYIIGELNKSLNSKLLNLNTKISTTGLQTIEDAENELNVLRSGNFVNFNEILDRII